MPESKPKPGKHEHQVLAGYLGIACDKVPERYNAGFSTYVSAWPLVETYPGNRFQTGLFGTWMHPQYDEPTPDRKLYCDIEGGLGWWRDTRFATETPKFIMGGVSLNFHAWANGPGAGKNRDWNKPLGLYGVAQLSPSIIWPPDGLNLKQGTCGELWGYGYLPLPLIDAKQSTAGRNVPTGGNCWTLFLNTGNFKGPVAFFTPYFFSEVTVNDPEIAGLFLDTRPVGPNRPHQMETQHIPCVTTTANDGQTYARIERTRFPRSATGQSPCMHQITAYDRSALWDAVQAWFDGQDDAAAVDSVINPEGAIVHNVVSENRLSWAIFPDGTPREQRMPLDWKLFADGKPLDATTFGYTWNEDFVTRTDTEDGPLFTLPEYYRLQHDDQGHAKWVAIHEHDVPAETKLNDVDFTPKAREPMPPYQTPDDMTSCWKSPGPVAGPFKVKLFDGSTVVYHWYRFADQPAMLNADLTDAEREQTQRRVEKLHAQWKPDREYFAPPKFGELAEIDPALVVEPPKGLDVGYVPIVTWQGIEK